MLFNGLMHQEYILVSLVRRFVISRPTDKKYTLLIALDGYQVFSLKFLNKKVQSVGKYKHVHHSKKSFLSLQKGSHLPVASFFNFSY
jgi:hypothetical protein